MLFELWHLIIIVILDYEKYGRLVNEDCRFSMDDARCTSALHTSAYFLSDPPYTLFPFNGLGILRPVAHYDFYVDGGLNPRTCRRFFPFSGGTLAQALSTVSQEPLYLLSMTGPEALGCQHEMSRTLATISFPNSRCFQARQALGMDADQCHKTQCPSVITPHLTHYNYDVCSGSAHPPSNSSQHSIYYITSTSRRPFCSPSP